MASHENTPHQLELRKNFKSSLNAFKRLLRIIKEQSRIDTSDSNTNEAVVNYDQFHDVVTNLFGQDVKSKDVVAFFQKMTKHPNAPFDWTEIFGYFQTGEKITELQTDAENTVFWVSKRETIGSATGAGKKKRDVIQSVVMVPTLDSVLTVSQNGTICLFNSQMRQYAWVHATANSWFLDCDFLNQMKRIVAVTERSIVVWDYKCHGKHQDKYICIRPMEHCLLCVCVVNSHEDSVKDEILVGDDAGFVRLFSFAGSELHPQHSKTKVFSQSVVLDSRKFSQFKRKLHNDCVVKVKYIQALNCFASSSLDSKLSLVLDNVQRIKDAKPVRGFAVQKGITAFAFCAKANMIATGGPDKVIRLWHPEVTNKPMAVLSGHLYSIADIAVNELDQQVISVSTARGFRVWDIPTLSLLQVFTDTQQGPGDHRINSMVFDNKHLRLLTGSCVLDVWPMSQMIRNTTQVPRSHKRPINALVYNQVFQQVLSICSESVLKVWDIETGAQVYEIKNAHGPTIEVTAAAIDISGFYFATGAYNGSVKIWEFGNPHQVKVLLPKKMYKNEEQSICQISYTRTKDNQHMIIALDISGNIKIIQGKEDDSRLIVVTEFDHDTGVWYTTLQSVQKRELEHNINAADKLKDQIMSPKRTKLCCFDAIKLETSFLIATGSISGEISLYSLEESSVQPIYSRNPDESINNTNLGNNLKLERINVVLIILPKEIDNLDTSRIQDISRQNERNSSNEHMKTSETLTECLEKETDKSYTCYSGSFDDKADIPLIVAGHENGHLYLWNTKGDLISEKLPFTKQPPIPITALCSDTCANVIIAGNIEGYIILWKLCKIQEADRKIHLSLKQELCWRAHSMKITSLFYENSRNVVVSASTDDSIRLWHASSGNYIGYFGQSRAYELTSPPEFTLPCDIKELPLQTKVDNTVLRTTKNFEIPLIYESNKLNSLTKHQDLNEECVSMKYFKCLSTPKVSQRYLKSWNLGMSENDAVFSALQIHQLQNMDFGNISDMVNQYLSNYE
ncbi:WD repeat-containing protein 64 [Pyxicephalus adspersus]|uniref:WD repeat-containing protein 64 n=1 Tax=Pyxicephalus adspersus TaxID=30357 RepID=UPI003B596E2D